jgi:hypothetical protein
MYTSSLVRRSSELGYKVPRIHPALTIPCPPVGDLETTRAVQSNDPISNSGRGCRRPTIQSLVRPMASDIRLPCFFVDPQEVFVMSPLLVHIIGDYLHGLPLYTPPHIAYLVEIIMSADEHANIFQCEIHICDIVGVVPHDVCRLLLILQLADIGLEVLDVEGAVRLCVDLCTVL